MQIFLSSTPNAPKGFTVVNHTEIVNTSSIPNAVFVDNLVNFKSALKESFSTFQGIIIAQGEQYKIHKLHQNCCFLTLPVDFLDSAQDIAESHLLILKNKHSERESHLKVQERFELFSNVAREGLVFHKNGVISEVNQALLKMFNETDRDAIIGMNILDFTVPEERAKVTKKLSEGDTYIYETICHTKKGLRFPVRVSGFNYEINGETFRVASIHNISELKKAEDELRVTTERLSLIAQSTGAGHYDWEFPDGQLYWNSTMHEMFELNETSTKSRNEHFQEVVHPDDKDWLNKSFEKSLSKETNQSIFTTEFRIVTPRKTTKHIEVLSIHKRDENNNVKRIIGVCTDITTRKLAEQSLKDSEAMLKLVINAIPQNLYWKDVNSTYMGCNRVFSKSLNLSHPSQIKGKTDFDITPDPEAAKRFREWDQRIMNSGQPEFHQLVHEKNNQGGKSWIDISKTPIKNHKGEIIGTLGTFEDVSKKVEAESQIHKLTRAIEQSINGIAITNLDGFVEYANAKLCKLLKTDSQTIVQSHYSIFNAGSYSNPQEVKKHVLNGEEWKEEICLHKEDQEEIWISSSLSPIKDKNGKITHFLSVQNDISKQYQIRTELKASEKKYREMLEQLPVAIIEVNQDLSIYYANSTANNLFGADPEAKDEIISKYIAKRDVSRVMMDAHYFLTQQQPEPVEYTGLKSDGEEFPILVYLNIIETPEKRTGIRAVIIDITERKIAEKKAIEHNHQLQQATTQLRQTNIELNEALLKAKKSKELEKALNELKITQSKLVQSEKMASVGVLSAGIAHEINNPLNFIQGGNYALIECINDHFSEENSLRDELMEYAEMINEGVERTSKIVNSLNRFSRRSNADKEKCDFHTIIENCLVILQNQLKYKIEITKSFDSAPAEIIGNEGELHQVILNILHNSVQAISEKGTIDIVTQVTPENISIQISDNGHGIKAEHLDSITDPFFTTKTPGKGTGLGMSISYNIIDKHGGTITYESPNEKGCNVKLEFNNG